MPLKLKSKSKTGFKGVRARASGHLGVEFQCGNRRYWLDTFKKVDIAERAYDVIAWRFGRPREELNFPKIATQEDVEFIGPPVTIVPVNRRRRRRRTSALFPARAMRRPW